MSIETVLPQKDDYLGSDSLLFERAMNDSDDAAFNEFYELYYPRLKTRAARLVGQNDAEDVVQEAFANTWKAYAGNFTATNSEVGLLYTVVRNCAINHLRRRDKQVDLDDDAISYSLDKVSQQSSAHLADAMIAQEGIDRLLEPLTDTQQAVITRVFVEDKTYADTAEELGIAVGTVSSRVGRSLIALRELEAAGDLLDEQY